MVKQKQIEQVCPECGSHNYQVLGIRWRSKEKWSRNSGRIKVKKLECKDCGRKYTEVLDNKEEDK
jgi:ribosomal protein L33